MQRLAPSRLSHRPETPTITQRTRQLRFIFTGLLVLVLLRLAYWQIIKSNELTVEAEAQYERQVTYIGNRGSILFADGSPLVTNARVYRLFATPHLMTDAEKDSAAVTLARIIAESNTTDINDATASTSAVTVQSLQQQFLDKLHKEDARWVNLYQPVSEAVKSAITQLNIPSIGFDPYSQRFYPEASIAAHLTGFVGKTATGEDTGYFGLEGALDAELQPRNKTKLVLTDALGFALYAGDGESKSLDGRTVTTTIRRDVQFLLERKLAEGIAKYQAAAGEIIVMEPATGAILGLAAWPQYDQANFSQYDARLYKNPGLTEVFEPGSTFKVITVATGIETGAITPDTICTQCGGPRQFGTYTLKTWNEEYHPNITMRDALAKSDNVAMIYAAERIGADTFREYVQRFGIGSPIEIDLQEDTGSPLPASFRPVELATASFGQGIGTTSFQLLRAVAIIANHGLKISPFIVAKVTDPLNGDEVITHAPTTERVISEQTANQVTQMMVYAAQKGEAQWTVSRSHLVAGKTGTAQIARSGGYEEDQTVASFIGFAPPSRPQFVMLVKLTRPLSSPWAAETAAPLWYDVADELYLLLGIPPDYPAPTTP